MFHRCYVIHALIECTRLISPGTADAWIEPVVVEDDDGPILFDNYEDACQYIETDDIYDWVGGYRKIVGFEIHEAFMY